MSKQGEDKQVQGCKKSTQKFEIMGQTVINENQFETGKALNTAKELSVIKNYVILEGEKLIRITEIQVEDKIFKIRDSFSCASHLRYDSTIINEEWRNQPEGHRDQSIMRVSPEATMEEDEEVDKRKKTGNKVQEILIRFKQWTYVQTPSDYELEAYLDIFLKENRRYNKRLIVKLSKDLMLREPFLVFCQENAESSRTEADHLNILRKCYKICMKQKFTQGLEQGEEIFCTGMQEKKASK